MKDRLRYSLAVLFAGIAGILGAVVMRPSSALYAQGDPMCACTREFSTWCVGSNCNSVNHQCTGTSTLSTIPSCSSVAVGQYCVLSGTVGWVPDSTNCQVNISNGGLIGPLGVANMALFYFDARTTASQPFAYSTDTVCYAYSNHSFGWRLYVASKFSSGNPPNCVCTANDHWQIQGTETWRCKPE